MLLQGMLFMLLWRGEDIGVSKCTYLFYIGILCDRAVEDKNVFDYRR